MWTERVSPFVQTLYVSRTFPENKAALKKPFTSRSVTTCRQSPLFYSRLEVVVGLYPFPAMAATCSHIRDNSALQNSYLCTITIDVFPSNCRLIAHSCDEVQGVAAGSQGKSLACMRAHDSPLKESTTTVH